MRFELPAQKPARGLRFDHWGAATVRAPTWRDRTSLYAACPLLRAARTGALIIFISRNLQRVAYLSNKRPTFQL